MTQKQILKTLMSFGLSPRDSEIYSYLILEGEQKAKNLAERLKLHKQQLYRSLKRLQRKGLVSSTPEFPALFSAVPLEKVLELLIEAKKEQALALQRNRQELLSSWRAITKEGMCN